MSLPQSWVEVSAPEVETQPWLDNLVVRFRNDVTPRRLVHLDHQSFAVSGQVEPADQDLYATFVVSKALSITVQVRPHEVDATASSQEFSFVNTDIDVLDLIFCAALPMTVH